MVALIGTVMVISRLVVVVVVKVAAAAVVKVAVVGVVVVVVVAAVVVVVVSAAAAVVVVFSPIATLYGLDGTGMECRWGQDFPHPFRPSLGSSQPPIQCIPGHSRG